MTTFGRKMDVINNEPKLLRLLKKVLCIIALIGFVVFLVVFIIDNFGVDISLVFSELVWLHVGHALVLLGVLTIKDAFVKPPLLAVYIALFFFLAIGDLAAAASRTGLLVACGSGCPIVSYWLDVFVCILDFLLLVVSCAEFVMMIFIMRFTKKHKEALDVIFDKVVTKKDADEESFAMTKKTISEVGLRRSRMTSGDASENESKASSAFDDQ